MKKQFKIHKNKENSDFISIDLIEDGKTVGGYLLPAYESNRESIAKYLKKEGYTEIEKADHSN